jgi:sulfite exporter TauE/SafE
MGALWGLTPCALVYGLLPIALLSGSGANGAAIMLAFGVGTLPNLLAAQAALGRARAAVGSPARIAVAIVVAAFGLVGIHRALFAPDALGTSAYCVVPFDGHGTLARFEP